MTTLTCSHYAHIDELLSVKATINSLAGGTSIGDLEVYFELCDEKVEILSPLILGGGKAEVVLKGLTADGKDIEYTAIAMWKINTIFCRFM